MIENYNQSLFGKNDLSESDYYIKSGFGQNTVNTINSEVKQKFPNRTMPDLSFKLQDKDIVSYAYLAKSFQYPVKFDVKNNFLFKNSPVKGFRAASA